MMPRGFYFASDSRTDVSVRCTSIVHAGPKKDGRVGVQNLDGYLWLWLPPTSDDLPNIEDDAGGIYRWEFPDGVVELTRVTLNDYPRIREQWPELPEVADADEMEEAIGNTLFTTLL